MKQQRMPFLPWFHSNFLAKTQGWTLEERGAYFMLLGAQWETGPLPSDPSRLAAIVGVPTSTFKTLWKTLGKKFKATDVGLVNGRLEEHRTRSLELIDSRRRGAAKTNEQRWGSDAVQFPAGGNHDGH
jgi:uncharacterized protein YdaU (DUF1376 family)